MREKRFELVLCVLFIWPRLSLTYVCFKCNIPEIYNPPPPPHPDMLYQECDSLSPLQRPGSAADILFHV